MKKIYVFPDYYMKFHCIADKCPDSCCEKWEIVIDDETADIYENAAGEIGEKLRKSMIIDDEGDRVFVLNNGRCPFLEDSGLCEIHRKLGENCLCDTCHEYPRAVQDCGDFAECDLSLSCPEAARIILSEKMNLCTCKVNTMYLMRISAMTAMLWILLSTHAGSFLILSGKGLIQFCRQSKSAADIHFTYKKSLIGMKHLNGRTVMDFMLKTFHFQSSVMDLL